MRDFDQVELSERDLSQQSAGLLELLDPRRPRRAPAYALAMQLSRLVGAWRRSMIVRERLVYAPMIAAANSPRRGIASACRARMEGLAGAIEGCAQRWSSSTLIDDDRRRFAADLFALLALMRAHLDCDRSLLLSAGGNDESVAA